MPSQPRPSATSSRLVSCTSICNRYKREEGCGYRAGTPSCKCTTRIAAQKLMDRLICQVSSSAPCRGNPLRKDNISSSNPLSRALGPYPANPERMDRPLPTYLQRRQFDRIAHTRLAGDGLEANDRPRKFPRSGRRCGGLAASARGLGRRKASGYGDGRE